MKKLVLAAMLFLFLPLNAMADSIYFNPTHTDVFQNDIFSIDILADIDAPILGWGLDLTYDTSILSLTSVIVDPTWMGLQGMDGDFLAGSAFPLPVSGTGIALATLHFSADSVGTSDLILSVTPGDFTEGFALFPPGFADLTGAFSNSSVEVHMAPVPEPASLILFGVGLVGLAHISRRKKVEK